MDSDLTTQIVTAIGALSPIVAWVIIALLKRVSDKIPKVVFVLLPTIIGVVIGVVAKQAGVEDNLIIAALWANLAIALQEVQQKVAQWASDGTANSLVELVSKKAA